MKAGLWAKSAKIHFIFLRTAQRSFGIRFRLVIKKDALLPALPFLRRLDAVFGRPFGSEPGKQAIQTHNDENRNQHKQKDAQYAHSVFLPSREKEKKRPAGKTDGAMFRFVNQNFRLLILMAGPMVLLIYSDLM